MTSHTPEIAVTGSGWMGGGTGSIWSMIRDAFSKVDNEIQIAAYSITEGSGEFLDLLKNQLARKTRVMMVVNRFYEQEKNIQDTLLNLSGKYEKHFVLKNFEPEDRREDLHAKLIVIDHSTAFVGSANLTWKGMVMNHEIMIKLTDESAQKIGSLIDKLKDHPECYRITKNNSGATDD